MSKAYRIEELAENGPFSRSFLYRQIREGALIARKCGRITLILESDWQAFLASLPVIDRKAA